MPELPEVETIARALRAGGRDGPAVLGRRIEAAHLLWERTLAKPSSTEFTRRVPGQSILRIDRRAKFLVFSLDRDTLIIHLRMSGDLFVRAPDTPFATHDRLVLDLGDLPVRGIEEQAQPVRLVFNDPRKFGRAWLTNDPEEMFENLGPEPLDPNLTEFDFFQRLHKSRRQIKPLLMDQAFLAGMGNIYTDEALFLAKLNPVASADGLTLAQSSLLLRCIRQVLQDGIAQQGASIDWVYRGGDFQNYFRVYRRTGEPCPECGTEIHRTVVGQRSTHFCPQCQALTSVKEGFPVE